MTMKSTIFRRIAAAFILCALAAGLSAAPDPAAREERRGPAAKPEQPAKPEKAPKAGAPKTGADNYTLEQAISDQAQLHTISFSGVAFLTGTFGADTFLPPGKVADYFGFQYMRDIDQAEGGHNMMFLTNIANNTWVILNASQKKLVTNLALAHAPLYKALAEKRLPLIKAFVEQRDAKGAKTLSREAVKAWVGEIFTLDGRLSYERARLYGEIIKTLSDSQKAAFAKLKFADSSTWPAMDDPFDKRTMSHEQHVIAMSYASEFFSWYAGSAAANIYFCPERHGTYFGGFYMKDFPAVGNNDYYIPTALTGDSGVAFLNLLDATQKPLMASLVDDQRADLTRIVEIRTAIDAELRKFLTGGSADEAKVMALSQEYGTLDGDLSWLYADRFARIGATLTATQQTELIKIRNQPQMPEGAFLYADPIPLPAVTVPTSLWSVR